jgi:hypothetical protein|tara:strand:+ start:16 stop:657 length:642 start_codon:yes stop_codon:yes gene_type:complete
MRKKLEKILLSIIDPPSFSKSTIHGGEKSKTEKITLKPEFKFINNIGNNMIPLAFYEAKKLGNQYLKYILDSLNCEEEKVIVQDKKYYDLNNINIIRNDDNKIFNDFNNIEHFVEFLEGIEPTTEGELKIRILNKGKIIDSFNIMSPDWDHYRIIKENLFLKIINFEMYLRFSRELIGYADIEDTIKPEKDRWIKGFFSGYPDFTMKKSQYIK